MSEHKIHVKIEGSNKVFDMPETPVNLSIQIGDTIRWYGTGGHDNYVVTEKIYRVSADETRLEFEDIHMKKA